VGKTLSDEGEGYLERSARGAVILLIGRLVSTALSAATVILIARLIGSRDYGYVAMAMIPLSIANLLSNPGVSAGLTRYIAHYRATGRDGDIPILLKAGLSVNALLSLLLTLLLYLLSPQLSMLFHAPPIQGLLRLASLYVAVNTLLLTAQAAFTGFERMELYSLTSIVYSILRFALSIILILLGLGAMGAMTGNVAATALAALLGLLLLLPHLRSSPGASMREREAISLLLAYGFPLFISSLLTVGLNQLYNLLLASHVEASVVGNYQAAVNFSALLSLLTTPIITTLFPLFSQLDRGELREAFQTSVKYTALLLTPLTLFLIALSEEVVSIVYGRNYSLASGYLALYLVNFLFIGLGGLSVANLLNGQGETRVVFQIRLINLLLGLPMGFILIPRLGVVGLLITLIAAPRLGLFYGLYWIWRRYGFTLDVGSSAKIYLSSLAAFLLVEFLLGALGLEDWVSLLLGGLLYLILYVLLTASLRTLDEGDFRNLRRMSRALGPLSPLIDPLISLVEALSKRFGL